MLEKRESLDFDIVFIGAGPANLTAALHLQKLVNSRKDRIAVPEIAVVDKGRQAGAHLLSGAIIDPVVLEEYFPGYLEKGCPLEAKVTRDSVCFLTEKRRYPLPYLPEPFRNDGCVLVSLSRFGSWLADMAEAEGTAVLDSTAAVEPVIENNRLTGIITDSKGFDKDGNAGPAAEPGIQINAKAFVLGEGARGSMFRRLDRAFGLSPDRHVQRYETGVKEVWKIPAGRLEAGETLHTFGYPLPSYLYGGGWLYAMTETEISLGFVTSADPEQPVVDPHYNLQLFKEHPSIRPLLTEGKLMEYGAKSITSGGYDAMPQPAGPGFLLTGETAGLVNMQRLKGLHLAMHSGILAAETLYSCLLKDDFSDASLLAYRNSLEQSAIYEEMRRSGNYRKVFDQGLYKGLVRAGLSLKIPGLSLTDTGEKKEGRELRPGTKQYRKWLEKKDSFRPDGLLFFSKEADLYASGTVHEENQPCHLLIEPDAVADICTVTCKRDYGNPCQHFCPAGVYAIDYDADPILRLSPSNCLHCKTCEIADPYGIITWTPPEGGGGPGYTIS